MASPAHGTGVLRPAAKHVWTTMEADK